MMAAGEKFVFKFGLPEGILLRAGKEGGGVLVCSEDNQGGALPGGGTAQSRADTAGRFNRARLAVEWIIHIMWNH